MSEKYLVRHVINRRRLAQGGLPSIQPSDGDPERLVRAELVRRAAYDKRHRFSFFQGCFQALLGPVNPD
jgi:hypothetical protein